MVISDQQSRDAYNKRLLAIQRGLRDISATRIPLSDRTDPECFASRAEANSARSRQWNCAAHGLQGPL
ncbi:hypothetical protein IMZ48_15830 [Candidatus Bathyarchaeota archaeon]|nr:hypothetical protein [Candidatus Bathyarchaeota archaeon]